MASIRLEGIRKAFGRSVAIDHLDLAVSDGELLVLLGPSGCGKSTTLNIIAGLATPTSGRVMFDAEDATTLQPHQRNIAMVFQSALLYPHLTARQNIAMSLRRSLLDKAELERRVADAAAIVDVTRHLDKMPSELSGGERQRVATAKAIVRHPAAFLLDEPLGALDAALRLSLRSELVNLQKRMGTTMVFVTHDQTEAMTMGDRIAVMRDGRLEQIGPPNEIYENPATLFVAGFVGTPPMNLLRGSIETVADVPVFRSGELAVPLPHAAQAALVFADVTLAVRPHDLQVLPTAAMNSLPVNVFALEHLGHESVVIFEAPGRDKLRAAVAPEFAAQVGQTMHVAFEPIKAKLFDARTERLIRLPV
jgi:ABC-type sugar transport system ATPase subunit